MREAIKTVLVNYAACAVLGGFIEYLTPLPMKKTVRNCVVLVMLALCFIPFAKTEINMDFNKFNEESLQQSSYDALMHKANLMEKAVYGSVKEVLIYLQVDEYEIYVSTEIDEVNNTVYFEEIKVEVAKEYEQLIPQIKENRLS